MVDFIPVLCCSKSKRIDVFYYNNHSIKFVASPKCANDGLNLYCIPDDKIPGYEKKWRDLIVEQNHENLVRGFELYKNDIYRYLYQKYGDNFYILSAGWGIIRSSYKLPAYNISYSKQADELIKRTEHMQWNDFNHLQDDVNAGIISSDAVIVLFSSVDYLSSFYNLTSEIKNRKKIFFKAKGIIQKEGYEYEYYNENIMTNWFYKAARNFK